MEELKKRLKSFAWATGSSIAVLVVASLAGMFNDPTFVTAVKGVKPEMVLIVMIVGNILEQVTKVLNKTYGNPK